MKHYPVNLGFESGQLKAKPAIALLFLLMSGMIAGPARAQHFRISDRIISDPLTGAALMGYDAVSLQLGADAREGSPAIQSNHAGKVWYFVSRANQAAFEADPDAYVPAFGGYDPVAITHGVLTAGGPVIHLVQDGTTLLFRSAESRRLFMDSPGMLAEAWRLWPQVQRDLSP